MKLLECFYTAAGFQRPVKSPSAIFAFSLEGAPEGSFIQYTEMECDYLNASKSEREAYADSFVTLQDTNGVLSNVAAIRVFLASAPSPFAKLEVLPQDDPALGCIGELTKINCSLAQINHDMRGIAVAFGA